MSENKCFSFLPIPTRPPKPRNTGVTMMIDWGLGPAYQEDLLRVVHESVDIAKIAVGISGIIESSVLKEKMSVYKRFQVEPFIGGQFLEYGIYHKGVGIANSYFEHAAEIGFTTIEVSDNTISIEPEEKYKLIQLAKKEYGLTVLGEVGSKRESSSIDALVQGIHGCLAAGSWKVFLEGAELVDKKNGGMNQDTIQQVASGVDIDDVMFELPGIWLHNVHSSEIHDMSVYLIKTFGQRVNMANVMPQWILELETLRTGVGVSGVGDSE